MVADGRSSWDGDSISVKYTGSFWELFSSGGEAPVGLSLP
ncbi:uncharacterized protein METZ01_LOCUS73298 [marine metagenome]|uniref:Uncharacterized protein n=1 Tax=marine metagenome TaxID=408172 RepID=A0A381TXC2_9ZZZZ